MSSERYRGREPDPTADTETATLAGIGAAADAGRVPVFLPSEVLAGRFRVVRLLGRGGMGEIYEVEDFELGERVAVKTLRSRLKASDAALALFRGEVQLARRVTHPNVCRTFDVFRHRRQVGGRSESVLFATLELLDGETMSARLRRDGPLPLAEALPLAAQVAAALDAAHDAGVVHRDLKSGNVVLVDGAEGRRAVVTDFGLAGAVEGAAGSPGTPYGTRPYRAPEQEAGEPAGAAADLHAFGVVLAEMLAGTPEWAQAEPRLPPAVAAVIRRCLERDPAARPARAGDVVASLRWLARPGRPLARRLGAAAAAALLALLPVAVLATWPLHHALPAPRHPQLAVLVVPTPAVACPRCLGFALAELAAVELAGSGIEVMDAGELDHGSDGLAPAVLPGAPRLEEGRRLLGAELVTEVRVEAADGGGRRFEIEVLEPGVSRTLVRAAGDLPAGGPAADAARLAVELRRALELRGVVARTASRPPPSLRRARVGRDPRALELYARGRLALGESRPLDAVPLLRKAVALEPRALRLQHWLAEALTSVGGEEDAAKEAALVVQRLAGQLEGRAGGDARLEAAILQAQAFRDRSHEAELQVELLRRHPERTWLALQAAESFTLVGRLEEARQVLDALAASRPGVEDDPRYLHQRVFLHDAEGDYEAGLASARAAVRRSRELGLRAIQLPVLRLQFYALRQLGRDRAAAVVAEEAVAAAEGLGRPRPLAVALRMRGMALAAAGEGEAAEAAYRRSLDLSQGARDAGEAVWSLNNLGTLASARGELAAAASYYEEALDLMLDLQQPEFVLLLRSNLSEMRLREGRLDESERTCKEILTAAQTFDSPHLQALVTERLAEIELERGDLRAASDFLERLEALTRDGETRFLPALRILRVRHHLLSGEPAAARREVERALAAARTAGSPEPLARAFAARGAVELAEGDARAAVASYREALETVDRTSEILLQAKLHRELGRAWLATGDTAVARDHLETALAAHRRFGAELETAHDLLALAELSFAIGDSAAVAAHARPALDAYLRLGDVDGAAAAEALLARRGGRAAVAVAAAGVRP